MPAILLDATGVAREVPDDLVPAALERGWTPEDTSARLARVAGEVREEEYGGVGGAIKATVAAGFRGATVGLSDVAARALGGDQAALDLEGYRDVNPVSSIAGEIVGGAAPAILSGGLGTAARAIPTVGANIAGKAVARAAGGGLRGALAGGAVEGGLQGIGAGISELALSTDPLTMDRAASVLGSNMLFGGVVGSAAEGTGHLVEKGLVRAKTAIDGALERRAVSKAKTPAEAVDSGDLSLLDKRTLDVLEADERARLFKEQEPERKAFVDDLDTFRRMQRDEHELRATLKASEDANIREATGAFDRANMRLRGALDDKFRITNDPTKIRTYLRAQRQSLDEIADWTKEQRRLWQEDLATAPERFRADLEAISSKPTLAERTKESSRLGYGGENTGPYTPAGLDNAVELLVKANSSMRWGGAAKHGLAEPSIVQMQPEIDRLVAWNEKMQGTLDRLEVPQTSDRLGRIAEARVVLDTPKPPSVGQAVLNTVAPFAGPAGVAAQAGNRIVGNFRKVVGVVAEKTGKVASAFAGAAAAATPYAPVVATKVLQSVRYAASRDDDDEADDLPKLFKRRSDEVKALTEYDEMGTPRIRPEARADLAARLRPIAAVDPLAADRLETAAVRRLEHVSSLIPRQPDFGGIAMPDWQPSDMQIRSWARTIAASENPDGVEERTVHGAITPEDVAAYWAVYPERAEDFKRSILGEIHEGKTTIPYERKLALSMLIGEPVDPSLHPRVIASLQGSFPAEPGSQGGAQAPRAQPQMGSLKKVSENAMTPAQERQR